ncbi:MAG: hypothetical protein RLZZ22_1114 [Pseudomonadota bacterium]|jgi:Ni/Co efflux regulator RcnB
MNFAKIAAMALCASAVTLSCWAEKPDWAGGQGHKRELMREHEPADHGANQDRGDRLRRDDAQSRPDSRMRAAGASGTRFGERHRESVRDYFEPRVRAGRCPPGLAKKNNGCLPPGQARQWVMGQALPHELVRYPLPVELQRRLGRPPVGYEYMRVDNDILLLIIGTGMVVDAIENLGGF